MDDADIRDAPALLPEILGDTRKIGFDMGSEPKTGALLRALAASKPAGRFLELGTGTGIATAWLLAGMDADARLDTVDNDAKPQAVARAHLGQDDRVTFHLADAAEFLARSSPDTFDLVFADAWVGKFTSFDAALALVRAGGFYVVDDLLPQANWPDGHGSKVATLVRELDSRQDFVAVRLAWASGLAVLVRR